MNLRHKADRLLRRGITPFLLTLCLPLTALAAPPAEVAEYGYTENTFSSAFTAATVDMNHTLNRGYKWYLADIYGYKASPSALKINGDGSATLLGNTAHTTGTLMTVAPYHGTNSWVGTAFGGGAYIEAVFAWNPKQVLARPGGPPYPAFWSLPMEGNFAGSSQWVGQASGYMHDVELDFFEADVHNGSNKYGVGLHDWWGILNKTCSGFCKISPMPSGVIYPSASDVMTQYHTYGLLWVPATATKDGFVDAFFDGARTNYKVSWTKFTTQAPTPAGKSWAYGKLDQQHMFFILGTGTDEPFQVKSVNVWQKNTAENMTN